MKTCGGSISETAKARKLTSSVKIVTDQNYPRWGSGGKGMETDGNGKDFPFLKDTMASRPGTLEVCLFLNC